MTDTLTPRSQGHLYEEAIALGTATMHEAAGRTGALPPVIRQMTPGLVAIGPAFPVASPPGDNLWLHRAVYAAAPGDVLVATVGDEYDFGYWGEVLSCAAAARGIAGLILDGCVRDYVGLGAVGVPVFARGLCIRGTEKVPENGGSLGQPVQLGEVRISHGDFVLADVDGVFSQPMDQLASTVAAGRERENHEREVMQLLVDGARTLDIYELPEA